jgi:hypothetical protein
MVGVHRLLQAAIQARLSETDERRWAEVAVGLLYESFPAESWEVATWPTSERLLPQVFAVAGHTERLGIAGEQVGLLLYRSSGYLERRRPVSAGPATRRAWSESRRGCTRTSSCRRRLVS